MITVECGACGVRYRGGDDRAGGEFACVRCGTVVKVPLPIPEGTESPDHRLPPSGHVYFSFPPAEAEYWLTLGGVGCLWVGLVLYAVLGRAGCYGH